MLKYLLDEHIPPSFQTQLLRLDPALTVWRLGEPGTPPLRVLDPEILVWCEANDFVLVTNNRASMPVHLANHLAAGHHMPGIVTVDLSRSMGLLLGDLVLLASTLGTDECQDRIVYLPL